MAAWLAGAVRLTQQGRLGQPRRQACGAGIPPLGGGGSQRMQIVHLDPPTQAGQAKLASQSELDATELLS